MKIESTHDVKTRETAELEFAATPTEELRYTLTLITNHANAVTFNSNAHNYLGIRKLAAERELAKR